MPRKATSAGPHPIDIMVGKRVRLRRLQLSMSQTELAVKVGVTFQQVQKYEKGTNRISCSRLSEMAEALDVPINFFFSDEKEHQTEMTVTENLDPGRMKDGLRLLTAFGRIEKTNFRHKLLGLVEDMVRAEK
ncbi:MAG TPA: helix-turn-helix domain-containing protein [Xanthobacteraceae bacterium]|jgi:transcriptional regulator with XRE-family HTH domain|nr:helix-turn-helix domain-containing protein [Xanthobacteraceae bacterium]